MKNDIVSKIPAVRLVTVRVKSGVRAGAEPAVKPTAPPDGGVGQGGSAGS